jgi:hypothetical protein
MLYLDGTAGLIMFGLWIFCIIDAITTDEAVVRNLPKTVWVLLVIFLFDIGSILWLVAGRPWGSAGATANRRAAGPRAAGFPEYDRPGRFAAANPDDDDAFLAQVRARAEAQRREYEGKRAAELEAEQDRLHRRTDDDR